MRESSVVPRVHEVVGHFFVEEGRGASVRRAERLRAAEHDLRACLDALAPFLLADQERALLHLERQFEPRHAVARVAPADALLLVLPVYLDEPRWHGEQLEDRRLRIRLAERLAEVVQRLPALRDTDLGRAAWVVDAAIRHETWLLRQERRVR